MEEKKVEQVEESNKPEKKKVDERLLYIIPSVIALCVGLTALFFALEGIIINRENSCYYLYIDAPVDENGNVDDEKNLEIIDKIMISHKVDGFTVLKNLQGGTIDENGELKVGTSYQIILMKIEKDEMIKIVHELLDGFDQDMLLLEGVMVQSNYVDQNHIEQNIKEFYDKQGK